MKKSITALLIILLFIFSGCQGGNEYVLVKDIDNEKPAEFVYLSGNRPPQNAVANPPSAANDSEKPVIISIDGLTQNAEAAKVMELPRVRVKDNIDTNPLLLLKAQSPSNTAVEILKDNKFHPKETGQYRFTYRCVDFSGNAADDVTVVVNVQDTMAPQINLRGFNEIKGYKMTSVKAPSPLVDDFYDCLLEVRAELRGSSTFYDIDPYALTFVPETAGVYDIIYTAAEDVEDGKSSQTSITAVISNLSVINGCNIAADKEVWYFGGNISVNPKPYIELDTAVKSEGSASLKLYLYGSQNQTETDGTGFKNGTTVYTDYEYCGTSNISGYDYVAVDIYNAGNNAMGAKLWTMDKGRKAYGNALEAVVIPAKSWATLTLDIRLIEAAGLDSSAMLSILITFEGSASGLSIFNIDNYRII